LTRRTRIVCISDTHNQTPKLPKGDVLIHAGDITALGSFAELQKMVEWLEKADFEAKIVVAGNHDLTLDAEFDEQHKSLRHWTASQDAEKCRRLLRESNSITYLENQAATIYLASPTGPHTCFKVFGSPCSPTMRNWAFGYQAHEASKLWDAIPSDTDIVVTHTPPKDHCDTATEDVRTGCEVLLQALYRVRPMLSVFGHIHEARGVERVRWNVEVPENGRLEEAVEKWQDPGIGNNKQSLVDLTAKGGRPLDNASSLARPAHRPEFPIRGNGGQPDVFKVVQPGVLNSTSPLEGVPHNNSEANVRATPAGAVESRPGGPRSDIGFVLEPDVETVDRRAARRETVMINAAFLGPRTSRRGGPTTFHKPVVVDIDLPVWAFE
ncbi:Metallo-dependent phosphatase-like protein, partial [Massariosphaeria phaeospora]